MNTYKTASALEGLFDLAYDDKIRIESFSRAHGHTTGNEEYLLTIRVIRKTAEEKAAADSADTDRTAHPGTNPKELKEKTGEKTGEKAEEKNGEKAGEKTREKTGEKTEEKNGDKSKENPAEETISAAETASAAAGTP